MVSSAFQASEILIELTGMFEPHTFSGGCPLTPGSTCDASSNGLYLRSTIQLIPYRLSSTPCPLCVSLSVDDSFDEQHDRFGNPIGAAAWVRRVQTRVRLSEATFFTGVSDMKGEVLPELARYRWGECKRAKRSMLVRAERMDGGSSAQILM